MLELRIYLKMGSFTNDAHHCVSPYHFYCISTVGIPSVKASVGVRTSPWWHFSVPLFMTYSLLLNFPVDSLLVKIFSQTIFLCLMIIINGKYAFFCTDKAIQTWYHQSWLMCPYTSEKSRLHLSKVPRYPRECTSKLSSLAAAASAWAGACVDDVWIIPWFMFCSC